MSSEITTGIGLSLLAGTLLGTFAAPMKKMRIWQWEHSWLVFSFWALIVLPLVLAVFTVPSLFAVYSKAETATLLAVFAFGAAWGVANVGFGMGIKMLGLAMATAIVLGLNNAIGAILPIALYAPDKLTTPAGLTILGGVLVMIAGIVVCAIAGHQREKALATGNTERPRTSFSKGLVICLVAGVFGAMFNFALINGKPLEEIAIAQGAEPLQAANATWVVALGGGFMVTMIYCLYLVWRGRSIALFNIKGTGLNYLFGLLMGLMWFGGVALYGMGVSRLGDLGASIGWPLIQSMAVGSGNVVGILSGEWKNSGKSPVRIMLAGLTLLFAGMLFVGSAAGM